MANIKIKLSFSNTTKEALKASANVKEVTMAVVRYMDYFIGMTPRKAYIEHAKMRFAPQVFIEKTPMLAEASVPVEVIEPLYQDLAANYAAMHPNCWLNDDQHDFPQSLVEAVGEDRTVLKKIQDTVGNAYASGFYIGHLRQLLNSKESNFRFGGLRKLGFTKKEAEVLLSVAPLIYEYVSENFTVRPRSAETVTEVIGEATPELPEAETVTAVEAVSEVTDDATSETTVTAVEAVENVAPETTVTADESEVNTEKERLAEKLNTVYIMIKALEAQINDIASDLGVELK